MTLVIGWIDTGRHRKRNRDRQTETEKQIPKVEIQPPALFIHVFPRYFVFSVMFEIRREITQSTLMRRVKVECSIKNVIFQK